MYFYDDNEIDNKKSLFEKKYGKLSSPLDIVYDLTKKEKNNKEEIKNIEQNKNILQKRKRKRHDSSDEEEKKIEAEKNKKKEEKKEKEEFIDQINNVENFDNCKSNNENNESNEKDSWKRGFVDIEELNKKKIEVKEVAKSLDDPMKNLLSKNKVIEETDELIKKRGFYLPKCKFAPLNNRFDIKPGYRWDGVNRSNGFENKVMNLNFNINN